VLVIDGTERPGKGDAFVIELLKRARVTAICALNKTDLLHKPRLLPLIAHFGGAFDFAAVVPISASTGDGVDALEAEIVKALPEGEPAFPADYLTDQTERTLTAELIREKVLHHTRDELPYSTAVIIDKFEEPEPGSQLTKIYASILVDSESQKPIVVGKGGSMIKRIGTEARIDLEEMLGTNVFLDLHVKVRADWRDNLRLLDELGVRGR
jgi:GTP-binding protein Era